MKRITLCADDFGMHPGASEAIIKLAKQQRIQAISCLVTTPEWCECADQLNMLNQSIDLGLHLNFTDGAGLSSRFKQKLPGLLSMLCRSHLGLLTRSSLEEEITKQLEHFIDGTGKQPDFIDGHQHVHHLPVVRTALLAVITKMNLDSLWIRSVSPLISTTSLLKSQVIVQSGARALKKSILNLGMTTNSAFAGVYSLSPDTSFPDLMKLWMQELPDRGLIMCHPGIHHNQLPLLIHSKARQKEFDYLQSNDLLADCSNANVCLYPLSLRLQNPAIFEANRSQAES